ncbi:hypothetical protein ACJIZ3_019188 [Penstemon smallii]|uniref:J domain-containing protein n=1 Tax=Penstemon smallii TaxID=265156 RepID=A0ABD3T164_9LAMI
MFSPTQNTDLQNQMEHHTTTSRAEAERLLGIAEKLLRSKDLSGCRDFSILAQETEPLLEGSDQILAVAEVLLAADQNNNQQDWYSILQLPHRTTEPELIKKQYRRLALLLHPDKNKYPFADSAFRLVAEAWAVLSEPTRKSAYDSETLPRFTKVDLGKKQPFFKKDSSSSFHKKLPVRRSGRGGSGTGPGSETGTGPGTGSGTPAVKLNRKSADVGSFWTACPYCYNLYEYSRMYEGCCLRCENGNCGKVFTGAEILSMPPLVQGKEAYYCCWGVFPMGFRVEGGNGFPKWMPDMFGDFDAADDGGAPAPPPPPENVAPVPTPQPPPPPQAGGLAPSGKKKRGRPRKNL